MVGHIPVVTRGAAIMPFEPVLDDELNDVVRDLEATEPPVASTPGGIDSGSDPGASAWQLWELSTPRSR
jgi:hypothetical protein